MRPIFLVFTALLALLASAASAAPSLHELLEQGAGGVVVIPPGTHEIDRALVVTEDGTRLVGHATIVQTNPEEDIISFVGLKGVGVENLRLVRPEDASVTGRVAIRAEECEDVALRGVDIRETRSNYASIWVYGCRDVRIDSCTITGYKRINLDDRTGDPDHGYAFNSINGVGITVRESVGVRIARCRIAEHKFLPTKEIAKKHDLGRVQDGKKPLNPGIFGDRVIQDGYVQIWHQGSAIETVGAGANSTIQLLDNYVLNSAQGFDIHADKVICRGNTVEYGMIGIKVTHGSRDVLVADNVVRGVDLWGILLNPGVLSEAAKPATEDSPAEAPNVDRAAIVAHNVVTDTGRGTEAWNWSLNPHTHLGTYAIALFEGQLPDDPPLRDVLIEGNIVDDTSMDEVDPDKVHGGGYRYAIYMGKWDEGGEGTGALPPEQIIVRNNLLKPGSKGVSNVYIPSQ